MARPIGILGGTFDPVHYGHLRLAIECLEQLELQEVRLVPLHTPPHRQSPYAGPEERLAMLKLATDELAGIVIDECELHREEVSYTVDTVAALRQRFNNTPLCLITGADAFNSLHTWRDWQSLLDYVHIINGTRSHGSCAIENDELAGLIEKNTVTGSQALCNTPAGHIYNLDIPLLDISATRIRTALAEGRNASGLLPGPVLDYIHSHKLYNTA